MKIIPGFRLRPLGDEHILIGESVELVNFNKMITMNETAAYMWKHVEPLDSFTVETLAEALLAEYDVAPEQAHADAAATVKSWLEAGIVEE